MEKRYQVFVSSTYEDLKEERQEVVHALLELDCMPAGMELFPAASEDQWTLIKQVIDDCDYYIVIVGGRYGSLGPEGMGYTEMEYRYALDQGKPVIAFLHKDPDALPARRTEKTEKKQQLLEGFRQLLQQRMCKYWSGPADLGSVVSRSLVRLIKAHPATGWVRADRLATEEAAGEMLELRRQIEELEAEIERSRTRPPEGTEDLAQGNDEFELHFTFSAVDSHRFGHDWEKQGHASTTSVTWNEVFAAVGPLLIDEAGEARVWGALNKAVASAAAGSLAKERRFVGKDLSDFEVRYADFQTVKVQLRALGLIAESVRKRSLKDRETYWTLTPFGDQVMTRLRAIRRDQ